MSGSDGLQPNREDWRRLLVRTILICLTLLVLGSLALSLFFEEVRRAPPKVRNHQRFATLSDALRPPRRNQVLVHTSTDGARLRPHFLEIAGPETPRSECLTLIVDEVLQSAATWLTPGRAGPDGGLPFARRAVFQVGERAVVDLAWAPWAPDLDFRAECLLAYGIVNSLADNFEEIHEVSFLIDGLPAETLSGALDISQPLVPNVALQAMRDQTDG